MTRVLTNHPMVMPRLCIKTLSLKRLITAATTAVANHDMELADE